MKKLNNDAVSGLELAKHFEVEELEERIEFGAWEADAEVSIDYDPTNGWNNPEASATIRYVF